MPKNLNGKFYDTWEYMSWDTFIDTNKRSSFSDLEKKMSSGKIRAMAEAKEKLRDDLMTLHVWLSRSPGESKIFVSKHYGEYSYYSMNIEWESVIPWSTDFQEDTNTTVFVDHMCRGKLEAISFEELVAFLEPEKFWVEIEKNKLRSMSVWFISDKFWSDVENIMKGNFD